MAGLGEAGRWGDGMTCDPGGILIYCIGAWVLLMLATGIALTRAPRNAPVIDDEVGRGDEMVEYRVGVERIVPIGRFYGKDSRTTLNDNARFWHDVAQQLALDYRRRDSQARALAQRLRLVRNTARECDQALRGELCRVLGLSESTSVHDLIRVVRDTRGKP